MTGIGHNSDAANVDVLNASAQGQLKSVIERIERLDEERKSVDDDKKEVYAEAKGNGFDVPTIKAVIRYRKLDRAREQERMAIFDLYLAALGEI